MSIQNEKLICASVAVCVGAWFVVVSCGMAQRLPAITRQTILGEWEAVHVEEPRVFVIDVRAENDCVVVVSVGPETDTGELVYRCKSIVVSASGKFRLEALGGGISLHISGKGEATPVTSEGILRATVKLIARDGIATSFKNLVFQKRHFGYFNRLRDLMDSAHKRLLIENSRSRKHGNPYPG